MPFCTTRGSSLIDQSTDVEDRVLLVDFDMGTHGHRGQYNTALDRLFGARHAPYNLRTLLSRRPVLFPMIEHGTGRFVLACLLRTLLGRRTVGFLFRPLPTATGRTLRLRAKRCLMRLVRLLPGARTIILLPFTLDPALAKVATDWIYDLQNWDLVLDPPTLPTPEAQAMAAQITASAAERPVIASIGFQTPSKGFDRFTAIYSNNAAIRRHWQFAYGGTVITPLKSAAQGFAAAGGFGVDRYVSDDELIGFYLNADLMWCVYDSDYDQASGILGRAMQLGVPVAVRAGSLVHRLCQATDHPHVAVASHDGRELLASPPARLDPDEARHRAEDHGAKSLMRLEQALGIATRENPFLAGRQ